MRRRRQIVQPVIRQDAEPWLALDAPLKSVAGAVNSRLIGQLIPVSTQPGTVQ
jgi:hypothetical protein